jgi:hypothetical protein
LKAALAAQKTVLNSFASSVDMTAIARAAGIGDLALRAGIASGAASKLETIAHAGDMVRAMQLGVTVHPTIAHVMGIEKANRGVLATLATSNALQAAMVPAAFASKLQMMDIAGQPMLAKIAGLSNPSWMQDLKVINAATASLKIFDSIAPAIEQQKRVQQLVEDLMRSVQVDPEGTLTAEPSPSPFPIAEEVATRAGIPLDVFWARTHAAFQLLFPILLATLMVTEGNLTAVFRSVTWSLGIAMLWAAATTPEEPPE